VPTCAHAKANAEISFIDSTPLAVCHNWQIAAPGKSSLGWFYGFKLHLVINDEGALLSYCLTPGNVDDRKPAPALLQHLWDESSWPTKAASFTLSQRSSLILIYNLTVRVKSRTKNRNRLICQNGQSKGSDK